MQCQPTGVPAMRGDAFFAEVSKRPPFTKLHPRGAGFFKDYLSREKVVRFGDCSVVNTNLPPFPSGAFDSLVDQFAQLGQADQRRVYSVTLAVTNRCCFNCWHCYNAGRSQVDLPVEALQRLAAELQEMGAVMVTLTGGEPLLRGDLEQIAGSFDERSCLIVGTTGAGLTTERVGGLKENGVFAVGISLDSAEAEEHDRLRGQAGAFETACRAVGTAAEAGLYPYVVSVATREFLEPDRFMPFMRFAGRIGALEVHLLEPSATGKLAGRDDVLLRADERWRIFEYQQQIAGDQELPILSSFAYIESPELFGCGAGLTHLYIDGSGEVCPCNLVPLSFGNIARQPLAEILERMGCHFRRPRTACVGHLLAGKIPQDQLPAPCEVSIEVCNEHLPESHPLPRFFQIQQEASDQEVGRAELRSAYDRVHGDYDEYWLSEAARPIEELVRKLSWRGDESVFEAGCGTGYGTALLAERAQSVVAADISEGMISSARQRIESAGLVNVRFAVGDALRVAQAEAPFDLVFSSWVLGYIPLKPFFETARAALAPGGRLAFLVHKENSPREASELFAELVAKDPSVLLKRLAFDFPRDVEQVRALLGAAGFVEIEPWQGAAVFSYDSPERVLEHLLKSGAGTAFYDAIDPDRREALTAEFLRALAARHAETPQYEVAHDFIACTARRA